MSVNPELEDVFHAEDDSVELPSTEEDGAKLANTVDD